MDVEGLTNAQATLSLSEVTRWQNNSSCFWTTSINALPPEILAQIFSLVLRAPESDVEIEGDALQILPGTRMKWAATTSPRVPLCLTHVCQLWRSIAIEECFLWTDLYLTIDGSESASNNVGELVSMFSQRSKSASLAVGVDFIRNKRSGASTGTSRTMGSAVIMGQFHEIAQRGVVEKQDLLPEPEFDIHLVSGVSRPNVVPLTEERYVWRYLDNKEAKDVRNVALLVEGRHHIQEFFSIEDYRHVGTAVTDLCLKDTNGMRMLSPEDLAVTLREMPMLKKLVAHVNSYTNGEVPPVAIDIVEMKNLKILELSWDDLEGGQVLDIINAPNLENLMLSGDIFIWEPWDHLFNFLARPARSNLKELMLEHINCTVLRLEECLRILMAESLKVTLEDCTLSDEILQSLMRTNDSGSGSATLSWLRSLYLISIDGVSGDCLVRCIEDSQRGTNSLEELYVMDCAFVRDSHCDKLHDLLRHHMEENLVFYPSESDKLDEEDSNDSASNTDEDAEEDLD